MTLLLAFAVSGWGLHYKLSLYRPSSERARSVAAKLLSQRERPVASTGLEAALSAGKPLVSSGHPIVTQVVAIWAMVALPGAQCEHWILVDSQQDIRPLSAALTGPSAPRAPPVTA